MLRAIEWIVLGIASTSAITIGVCRHRPIRIGPWLLLAGSVASLAVGDIFYALDAMPVAEASYYAMFIFVAAALLQLTRSGAVLVDRARLIDILAFACSALLVIWVFVIGGSGQLGKISAADVIGDLLIVAVAGRLWFASAHTWSAALLAIGAIGMLIGDVAYPLAPGWATESGYVVLYLAWGAAALHPSMAVLTLPDRPQSSPWRARWAALLGVSVITPPVVLFVEAVTGAVHDGVVIAVAAALTLTLTITRLADSVTQNSQALARERGLREASAALVAASDRDAVDEAIRAAICQLMPPHSVRRIIFATDDRELPLGMAADEAESSPQSWWLDKQMPGTVDAPGEGTLVCPLRLEPFAVARPGGGALVLIGRRDVLAATRDALEVLAGQAALALDRICLVEAVGRRDSDNYLRTVIRNTADMVLVIDPDQRIRYVSPGMRKLLGLTTVPPLATLRDFVHADDRASVRQALLDEGDGVLFCSLQRQDGSQAMVEATYRDLRQDRLVQGFVVTMRRITGREPVERTPHIEHVDELPAWVNRRSAQHKFRY
ncbi:PAS domain-containing protein [Mangrovihabitans endophyticus]|uniref:PAS domain-containing protein n=1 Tax=Mangrovihabitans endophyticus TaxID=1751298 RepID=A0A8J3C5Z3_9ACTN|nr:PAS domain-containing protein [Mangrovihabitans endophyticus]GGL14870.1 hypothetical protein GCM10012284_56980 [Mangrovihabitans endophyticus]